MKLINVLESTTAIFFSSRHKSTASPKDKVHWQFINHLPSLSLNPDQQ